MPSNHIRHSCLQEQPCSAGHDDSWQSLIGWLFAIGDPLNYALHTCPTCARHSPSRLAHGTSQAAWFSSNSQYVTPTVLSDYTQVGRDVLSCFAETLLGALFAPLVVSAPRRLGCLLQRRRSAPLFFFLAIFMEMLPPMCCQKVLEGGSQQ